MFLTFHSPTLIQLHPHSLIFSHLPTYLLYGTSDGGGRGGSVPYLPLRRRSTREETFQARLVIPHCYNTTHNTTQHNTTQHPLVIITTQHSVIYHTPHRHVIDRRVKKHFKQGQSSLIITKYPDSTPFNSPSRHCTAKHNITQPPFAYIPNNTP